MVLYQDGVFMLIQCTSTIDNLQSWKKQAKGAFGFNYSMQKHYVLYTLEHCMIMFHDMCMLK